MIKVAQHKHKRTSGAHIHTKKTISTTAATNKQRTRHYQVRERETDRQTGKRTGGEEEVRERFT